MTRRRGPTTARIDLALTIHFTVPPDWNEAGARSVMETRLKSWIEDPDNELRQAYGLFTHYQDDPAIAVMTAAITDPEEAPRGAQEK